MILVFEMVWTGTHHAPGNSATLQTIARAMPGETIRVFAEPSHLAELQADPALVANRGMGFVPIRISPYFRTKPHVVSARRFRQELATMAAALRAVPGDEPSLIFLISASSTAIYAAKLLAALSRRRIAIQVGMHGNLAEITGWRSRNPLIRAFDLRSALTSRHRVPLRFLVLEDAIRRELEHLAPEAAKRCDVLPLPINRAEIAAARPIPLAAPLRIGFVGQGTEAKGITAFLETARLLKARHGARIDFFLVGRPALGSDLARFSVLSHTVSPDHLSRDEFRALLGSMHYVFLPFQPGLLQSLGQRRADRRDHLAQASDRDQAAIRAGPVRPARRHRLRLRHGRGHARGAGCGGRTAGPDALRAADRGAAPRPRDARAGSAGPNLPRYPA